MNLQLLLLTIVITLSFWNGQAQAKTVEYVEDAYALQAPQELVDQTEKIAELVDFNAAYEIVVVKKPGLRINPWNTFVAYGINPQTNNPFIIINPEWFKTLDQEQQAFLLGRGLMVLKQEGFLRLIIKFMPFLFAFLSIGCIVFIFRRLNKTRFAHYKTWVKIVLSYAIVIMLNFAVINKAQTSLTQYLGTLYDKNINELMIQKTHNKFAAISALRAIDTTIKAELEKGETFWAPYADWFEKQAAVLR